MRRRQVFSVLPLKQPISARFMKLQDSVASASFYYSEKVKKKESEKIEREKRE